MGFAGEFFGRPCEEIVRSVVFGIVRIARMEYVPVDDAVHAVFFAVTDQRLDFVAELERIGVVAVLLGVEREPDDVALPLFGQRPVSLLGLAFAEPLKSVRTHAPEL